MADINEGEPGVDVIHSKKSEDLIGYVIESDILEKNDSIPEDGDEFWKPVTSECFKECDISSCHEVNVNLNRYEGSDASCNKSGSEIEYFEQNSMRKAISDDSIAFKRHEHKKKEIPDGIVLPTSFSEKTSPEMNKNVQYHFDDSAGFESASSEDDGEFENDEERFDFFREYEIKVDMLEYCDMAVDESFEVLKQHVLDLIEIPGIQSALCVGKHMNTANTKVEESTQDKEETDTHVGEPDKDKEETDTHVEEPDQGKEETDTHAEEFANDKEANEHSSTSHGTKMKLSHGVTTDPKRTEYIKRDDSNDKATLPPISRSNIHHKATVIADALCLLRNRFERFIAEVSEMIHLGALSVRHAQRVDQWGAEVQKTYQKIYSDHQKMKSYLEEKEAQWSDSRDQYQAEIVQQGLQITSILQKLHIQNEVPDTPRRHNDIHKTVDIVNSVLMKRRCQEEQAMTLDFSRQSKISELKLLVMHQQGYIHRLQLKNTELKSIIRDVLDADHKTQEEALDSDANHLENISDILLCDMAEYAPNKSCDPDVAGRQVFNIGDTKRYHGPSYETYTNTVYDPHKLSYICLDQLQRRTEKEVYNEESDRIFGESDTTESRLNTTESHLNTTESHLKTNKDNLHYTKDDNVPRETENVLASFQKDDIITCSAPLQVQCET